MDMQALQAAEAIASMAHKEQKYGTFPYIKHLGDVVAVLIRFGITDKDMLCAGWLHDSLEDTELTPLAIEATFGRRTLDLVQRVTNEPGKNRKERHEKTYPKIQASDDAITLKLADRIANTEASIDLRDGGKIKMYAKEYDGFREKLYKSGTHDAMWRHLDFLMGYGNNDPSERSQAW